MDFLMLLKTWINSMSESFKKREIKMFEDFFLIPFSKIDQNWLPVEFADELIALDYCEEILDIPLYFIEETYFMPEGLEVQLKSLDNNIIKDDWYVQLNRLSSYIKAS